MFNWLKRKTPARSDVTTTPLAEIDVGDSLVWSEDGIPMFSNAAVDSVLSTHSDLPPSEALTAASRYWMNALNSEVFAGDLQSGESKHFMLYGDVSPAWGRGILSFAETSLARYEQALPSVVQFGPASKMPILALGDEADYYRYISAYFGEGEFGLSGGLFVRSGLGHFVFPTQGMEQMDLLGPVIVHELFHALVSHLPLPAWLNEGMAVNAESTFAHKPPEAFYVEAELQRGHQRYWNAETLQAFWRGESFFNNDEGQKLSYDLARRLVMVLANSDAVALERLLLTATPDDAGEAATLAAFGHGLARPLAVILGRDLGEPLRM